MAAIVFNVPATDLEAEAQLKLPKEGQKALFKVQFRNAGGLALKFVINLEDCNVNAEMATYSNKYFCFSTYNTTYHSSTKTNKTAAAEPGDYLIASLKEIKQRAYTVVAQSDAEGLFLKLCPKGCAYLDLVKNNLVCPHCTHSHKYSAEQSSAWYGHKLY